MPNSCAILSCNSNYNKAKASGQSLSYFSFPADPDVRQLWVESCRRGGAFNIKNSRVCSMHFSKECYERDLRNELLKLKPKLRLIPGSVPTLFLGATSAWKEESSGADEIKPKRRAETAHEMVGINDIDAENDEEIPRRKKSRLDSIGILRRSVRKKRDSNANTNEDAVIKTESTNTSSSTEDQQSKAEDLNTNSIQNKEITESSNTTQNMVTTENLNTTQNIESTENLNTTQNNELIVNSNTAQSEEISGKSSAMQNNQVCENLNVRRKDENSTNSYLLLQPKVEESNGQNKETPNNISFVLQNNQSKAPENRSIEQYETTNACVTLENDTQKTNQSKLKQLCLGIKPNDESNNSHLREETLEEVVKRQRGEIKNLMSERDELREKVVDQEKKLAYLMEKYEKLTKEKAVKAIIYSIDCKHK